MSSAAVTETEAATGRTPPRDDKPRTVKMAAAPSLAGKAFLVALVLFLGCFGTLNLVNLMASAPSANPGLRMAGPGGDWRVENADALFDKRTYLRAVAFSYLVTAATAEDAVPPLRSARDAARASLDAGPGDAYTWSLLAWSEAILGENEAATGALERSWAIAPESPALSIDRLLIAEVLGLADPASDAETLAAIDRDLDSAAAYLPRRLARIVADNPGLGALWEAREAGDERMNGEAPDPPAGEAPR